MKKDGFIGGRKPLKHGLKAITGFEFKVQERKSFGESFNLITGKEKSFEGQKPKSVGG